jgi:hypothetical protein
MCIPNKPIMKRQQLDQSAHDEQGEQLLEMREAVMGMHIRLANAYGTSSREAKLSGRILRDVDNLRAALDGRAWREWRAGDLYYNRADVVERAIKEALATQDDARP